MLRVAPAVPDGPAERRGHSYRVAPVTPPLVSHCGMGLQPGPSGHSYLGRQLKAAR